MKRILLLFALIALVFPVSAQTSQGSQFQRTYSKSLDYYFGKTASGISVPWASTTEANNTIPITRRYDGMIILVGADSASSKLYWYHGGRGNGNLQLFTGDTTGLGLATRSATQATLVSGTNIKTVNGSSILGSGNLVVSGGGSDRLSTKVFYLSNEGVPNNASLVKYSSTFGTDGTALIQAILDQANDTTSIIVYVDTKTSVTGLTYKSNTRIIGLPGCGFILRNSSNKSLLRPANTGMTTIHDSNVVIENLILNGNGSTAPLGPPTQTGSPSYGYTNVVDVFGVKNFRIINCDLLNGAQYALLACRTENICVYNCRIDSRIDGCNIVGYTKHGYVGNCSILGLDDHIVVASDGLNWASEAAFYNGIGGDCDALVENCVFLPGGQWGIRYFSMTYKLNVTFRNITGETSGYVVHGMNNYTGIAYNDGPGHNEQIVFDNVNVRCNVAGFNDTYGDWTLSGNTKNLTIKNCVFYRDALTTHRPLIVINSGGEADAATRTIDALNIEGCTIHTASADTSRITFLKLSTGIIRTLNVSNTRLTRLDADSPNNSVLIEVAGTTVPNINLNNVEVDGANYIVHRVSGSVDAIQASNVRHRNANEAIGSFVNDGAEIPDLCVSNYFGFKIDDGTFGKERGDAFDVDGLPDNPNVFLPFVETPLDFTYSTNVLSESSHIWTMGSAAATGWGNIGVCTKISGAGQGIRIAASFHASAPGGAIARGGTLMLSTSATPADYLTITGVGLLCDATGDLYAVENGVTTFLKAANGLYYWVVRDATGACAIMETTTSTYSSPANLHVFTSTLTGALYPQVSCVKPAGYVYFPQGMRY